MFSLTARRRPLALPLITGSRCPDQSGGMIMRGQFSEIWTPSEGNPDRIFADPVNKYSVPLHRMHRHGYDAAPTLGVPPLYVGAEASALARVSGPPHLLGRLRRLMQ